MRILLLALAVLVMGIIPAPVASAEGSRGHSGGLTIEVACGDNAEYTVHGGEVYHLKVRGDKKRLRYRVAEDNSVLEAKPKGCRKGFKPFVNPDCYKVFHVLADVRGAISFRLDKVYTNRCDGPPQG